MDNLCKKYLFRYLLLVYLFMPDIKTTFLGNHIAKKKTKRLWLRDISKISELRSQKALLYSAFLLIN